MRNIILVVLVCFTALCAGAQTQSESAGRGFTIGVGVGAGTDMINGYDN